MFAGSEDATSKSSPPGVPGPVAELVRALTARDPEESHRAASPLGRGAAVGADPGDLADQAVHLLRLHELRGVLEREHPPRAAAKARQAAAARALLSEENIAAVIGTSCSSAGILRLLPW